MCLSGVFCFLLPVAGFFLSLIHYCDHFLIDFHVNAFN